MKLQVTQEHIDNGKRHDQRHCPIANALRDAGWPNAWVGWQIITPNSYYVNMQVKQPPRVHKFILDFDNGRPVKPHTFIIPQLTRPPNTTKESTKGIH